MFLTVNLEYVFRKLKVLLNKLKLEIVKRALSMILRRMVKNHRNQVPKAKVQPTLMLKKAKKRLSQILIVSTKLQQKVKIVLLKSVNRAKRLQNKSTIIKIRARALKQRNE